MKPRKLTICAVAFIGMCFGLPRRSHAQDAVPDEILERTKLIKNGGAEGTGFVVDYGGQAYLVTARHLVEGIAKAGATIQIWDEDRWVDYKTVRTLYPASADVDIAIFETKGSIPQPFQIKIASGTSGGPTLGQQVWFLGFPYGLRSHFANEPKQIPFIKRGTMSAVDASQPDAVVVYIDGFNNPGFSGGPIVFWDFSSRTYQILGVVKGYKVDTAKVLVNGALAETQLLVNSGILIAYSSKHILETIEAAQKQPTK